MGQNGRQEAKQKTAKAVAVDRANAELDEREKKKKKVEEGKTYRRGIEFRHGYMKLPWGGRPWQHCRGRGGQV